MSGTGNEALRSLGTFYCLAYLVSLVAVSLSMWLYWDSWHLSRLVSTLADVASLSLGVALLALIFREGFTLMVLWAPKRIEALKERGRREEREKSKLRLQEAVRKFGVEQADGKKTITITPEVIEFLAGDDEE